MASKCKKETEFKAGVEVYLLGCITFPNRVENRLAAGL